MQGNRDLFSLQSEKSPPFAPPLPQHCMFFNFPEDSALYIKGNLLVDNQDSYLFVFYCRTQEIKGRFRDHFSFTHSSRFLIEEPSPMNLFSNKEIAFFLKAKFFH